MQNGIGLEDLAAYYSGARMNLSRGAQAELVDVTTASRNYFRLFGARPVMGRTFSNAEDSPGGARVLVLSYGLWQRRFGSDPAVLGKELTLGGESYTVIGVLSPAFQPNPSAEAWIPLQADPNSTNLASTLTVAGRLSADGNIAQVNARVTALDQSYKDQHPRELRVDPGIRAIPLAQQITGDIRPRLLILLGAVGLVLMIACANVANLLLVRAMSRQREIAIRAALGAGRGRIIRQLLTESLMLDLAGGLAGLALGSWMVRALLAFLPNDLPRVGEIAAAPALDPTVMAFALFASIGTGMLFGLVPALEASRTDLAAAFHRAGTRAGGGRRHNRTRGMLVAAETCIAVVLLCGALLLLRSFAALHHVETGFNPHNVLTMETSLAGEGYSKAIAVDRLARRVVERTEQIPGVEAAAVASALPLWGRMDMIFNIPGRQPQAGSQISGDVQWRFVSPRYFDVLRIPLLSGRLLRDDEPGRTAVISREMARRYWPGENPVGRTIFVGPGLGPAYQVGLTEIVGIVGDVRERLFFEPSPVMYQAPSQIPDADMALLNAYEPTAILIRTRPGVPPMSVGEQVRERLLSGNRLSVAKLRTMERLSFDSTARESFNLSLLGAFAGMALLLAAIGIYGVMAYSVEQRTHEIGVRAALGAKRGDTVRLVLFEAVRMAGAGVITGIALAFPLTRLLRAELFQVTSSDPLTFFVAPSILLAIAVAAAVIPALRATRIDPMAALRHE